MKNVLCRFFPKFQRSIGRVYLCSSHSESFERSLWSESFDFWSEIAISWKMLRWDRFTKVIIVQTPLPTDSYKFGANNLKRCLTSRANLRRQWWLNFLHHWHEHKMMKIEDFCELSIEIVSFFQNSANPAPHRFI